jgi:hypothetical protein
LRKDGSSRGSGCSRITVWPQRVHTKTSSSGSTPDLGIKRTSFMGSPQRSGSSSGILLLVGETGKKFSQCLLARKVGGRFGFEIRAGKLHPKRLGTPLNLPRPCRRTPVGACHNEIVAGPNGQRPRSTGSKGLPEPGDARAHPASRRRAHEAAEENATASQTSGQIERSSRMPIS